MDFISGEDREQTLLLPDSLEDYVNEDNPRAHVYRQSPSFLDLCPKTITRPELRQAVSDYFLIFSQGCA